MLFAIYTIVVHAKWTLDSREKDTKSYYKVRVESVNADAEAFGDHWESSDCSMHSEAEALEHMKKRDRGHQQLFL